MSTEVTQRHSDYAPILLTIEQVADMAGVTLSRVHSWINQGKLVAVERRGNRKLYTRGAVEGLLSAVCPLCGARFKRVNLRQEYCGGVCRQRAYRLRIHSEP